MTPRYRYMPPIAAAIAVVIMVLIGARPSHNDSSMDLELLARLPVSADGRVKPYDSVARGNLKMFMGKQALRVDGKLIPPAQWLADVQTRPAVAHKYKVFRVDQPEVRSLLGLDETDDRYFAWDDIIPKSDALLEAARKANDIKAKERTPFQRSSIDLANKLFRYDGLQRMQSPFFIPPTKSTETWKPLGEHNHSESATAQDALQHDIEEFFIAYGEQDAPAFNRELSNYYATLQSEMPGVTSKAGLEVHYNRYSAYTVASAFYVLVFLLVCASFLFSTGMPEFGKALQRTSFWLLGATLALHTVALYVRIMLMGRPPVTNLYSSAIFIGWGCVIIAMILDRMYRMGLGTLLGSVIGFVTLVIAINLGKGDTDTMGVMQAVLDTNFWLATHVPTVTLGYSATFFAGAIGMVYILLGLCTPVVDKNMAKVIGKMMYGVICFALFLSFTGTVLGGIWADQSWGRFWGWDPKENGAVLIVFMNALILHARWAGMIQERGMAVLAVAGNIVTAFSWFGTNMLGVGLHSYGFMDSALMWLWIFNFSQLAIIGAGLIPQQYWMSFRKPATSPVKQVLGDTSKPGRPPKVTPQPE